MKLPPLIMFALICSILWTPLLLDAQTTSMIPADVDTEDFNLINLGPIGVRVKTDHRAERYPRSKSNAGTVMFIFENSLGAKVLEIGDEIVAVNGQKFSQNFTELIAEQITETEVNGGTLLLDILRDGKKQAVNLPLQKKGSYSAKWPYECEKSHTILTDACDWLVMHQLPNGRIEKKAGEQCLVLSSVSGLAMLGCDATKYKTPVKRIADFLMDHIDKKTVNGHFKGGTLDLWSVTYASFFLTEYYFKTNDPRVFKTLEFLSDEIYYRQFHQMSPEVRKHVTDHLVNKKKFKHDPIPDYWFSHGLPSESSNGYIHLGVNVVNATVAWSLMEKAGVKVDEKNLEETLDYVEKACVSGAMGYASFLNQKSIPPDAFGRTGLLALTLQLHEGRKKYIATVDKALTRLAFKDYYFSHATCVLGKAWGTIGMAATNPKQFRKLMDEMRNDFELLRLSDGSFVSNPVLKNRHGFMDLKTGGSNEKHRWTTAFNALIYAIGEESLVITGQNQK